jgi:MSHA biogenesis protein MshL
VSQSLLPPLRSTLPRTAGRSSEPRFDLIVTDAPIAQVLHSVVADTALQHRAESEGRRADVAHRPGPVGSSRASGCREREPPRAADRAPEERHGVRGARCIARELRIRVFGAGNAHLRRAAGNADPLLPGQLHLGQRRGVSDLQVVAGATMGSGGGSSGGSTNSGSGGGSSTSGSSGGGGTAYASNQASAFEHDGQVRPMG